MLYDDDRPWPSPAILRETIPGEPTHWIVENRWKHRGMGTDEWLTAQQPLVEALKHAEQDYRAESRVPVIVAQGLVSGYNTTIGGGSAGDHNYRVHWNGLPMEFLVVGHGPKAVLPECYFWRYYRGDDAGGIKHAHFLNVGFRNVWGDRCIGAPSEDQDHGFGWGLLDLEGCWFVGSDPKRYGGLGVKFNLRNVGRMAYRVVRCRFLGALEHGFYSNTAQADPRWGGSLFYENEHLRSTRSFAQIVNRASENVPDLVESHLLFSGNKVRGLHGDGGGAITVAGGHTGPISVLDLNVKDSSHAALVVWNPNNPLHGVPVGADGYANGRVIADGFDIDHGEDRVHDRDQIQVSSARGFRMGKRFRVRTNRAAFDLSRRLGPVEFEPIGRELSGHFGLREAQTKVRMDVDGESNRRLTDQEIDALAWDRLAG